MKKIGLCLSYKGVNYGMLLQAYATQQIIISLGYIPEIIEYKTNTRNKIFFKNICNICLMVSYLRTKIKNLKIKLLRRMHREFKLTYNLRARAANKFRKNKFVNIITYEGYDKLKVGAFNYHAVVVGSDQQWLPTAVFGNFNTLRFVDKSIKKISFATSMGVAKYPKFAREKAKEFLSRLDFISVREESAKEIINSLINKHVKVILDPTFLLNKEDWQKRIPVQKPKKEPYILCYFLGNSRINKQMAICLKKSTGLKLVSIRSTEEYSKFDSIFSDEIIRNAEPEEFVNLVRFADYICTDSFHGIAFSIINEKQFFAFYRTKSSDSMSRNTRIDNILSKFGLTDRLITPNIDINNILRKTINYKVVHKKLDKLRKQSYDFLIGALNN